MLQPKLLFSKFIFITYISLLNSQNTSTQIKIDSLFHELNVKPDSEQKVDSLIQLFKFGLRKKYTNTNILDEAIKSGENIYYINGIARAYSRKGLTARYQNNYSKSIEYHKRALNYFEKSTDTLAKIKCLNSIGVTYRKLNLEKQAFKYYFQAYDLSKKINHKRSEAIALNGIGNVFVNTKDYTKALYYFKKALQLELNNNNERGQEYDLANIGEVYIQTKQYDSAYIYLDKALKLSIKNPRKDGVGIKKNLLGLLFQAKGEYKTSNKYYQESITIFDKHKNTRYLSNTLINLGLNELRQANYNDAYSNINDGLEIAQEIHSKENILLGYEALSEYHSKANNYKKALEAYKLATIFKDSIINEASQKSIISSQIAYEAIEKDIMIKKLAGEKQLNKQQAKQNLNKAIYISIGSLIIIIGLILFFYLYRRNLDLAIKHKNVELKNYLLQINTLNQEHEKQNQNIKERIKGFNLSKREIEVLELITKGYSNPEIAEKLYVSNNTIKTHIKHIYTKLDVKNRVQAISKLNT